MAFLALTLFLVVQSPSYYDGLVINEVSAACEHNWVELKFTDTGREKIDISNLYVTMFYGGSEPLADEPVYIYSRNRPGTPWDDRFVVVYPARPGIPDETLSTGDTNGNGIIELYCDNYFASFWNTDCVVAIATGPDRNNDTIIDFVVYSRRGDSFNRNMFNNMKSAAEAGEWVIDDMDAPGLSAVYTGPNGLLPHQSISRRPGQDTNTHEDFYVTKFQTPGRENIEKIEHSRNQLFRPDRKRITVIPGGTSLRKAEIPFTVFENSQLKLRIFTSDGRMVYRSSIMKDVTPGMHSYSWEPGRVPDGMYFCTIEAVDRGRQISQTEQIIIIVSRRR